MQGFLQQFIGSSLCITYNNRGFKRLVKTNGEMGQSSCACNIKNIRPCSRLRMLIWMVSHVYKKRLTLK